MLYCVTCTSVVSVIRYVCLKHKVVALTIYDKVNITNKVTKSDFNENKIAKQINIPLSTRSTELKNKDNILYKYENNKRTTKRLTISQYTSIKYGLTLIGVFKVKI